MSDLMDVVVADIDGGSIEVAESLVPLISAECVVDNGVTTTTKFCRLGISIAS